MENLQLKLRNEILSVIFKLTNGIWPKVLLLVIVQTLITYFVITPLMLKFMGVDPMLFASMSNSQDLDLLQYQVQEMMQNLVTLGIGSILLTIVLYFVTVIVTCYVYLLIFRMAEAKLKGRDISFEEIFQDSFSPKVLHMAGAYIIITLITVIAFFLASYVIINIGVMVFLLFLLASFFITAFVIRFILSLPKIAYHDEGAVPSLKYSMNQITYGKGMKYTAIIWLAFIILGIVAGIVSYIFGLIGGDSLTFGIILGQVLNILIGSYVAALGISLITALFYRAEGVSEDDGFKIEDHLISED